MGKMNPILKEVRSLIKEIKKLDRRDNCETFPIAIIGGIYAKPKSSFFKNHTMWNFIQETDIGYLTSHERHQQMGFSGCPLSEFDDNVKIEVRDILKQVLHETRQS